MRERLTALAGVLAVPALISSPAHAATATNHPMSTGVEAAYHGQVIDLKEGWQGAHACVAFSATDVRCFDTSGQLADAVSSHNRLGATTASASSSCGGNSLALEMFSGTNWSGDELVIVETTGWENLSDFGWDNKMQSYANQKTCDTFLADGTGGSGSQLDIAPGSYSLNAGSWKNKASSALVFF